MAPQPGHVSRLLQEWRRGDSRAADQVVEAVYDELRRIARGMMRGERSNHTLQPTALVHEAYLRICRDEPLDVRNRAEFVRLMAARMKRHLIDHARRRGAAKRGGGHIHQELKDLEVPAVETDATSEQFLARLDVALEKLAADFPRVAEIIRLRFVARLSIEDTARALGLGTGTVKRDFALGRAWLIRALGMVGANRP